MKLATEPNPQVQSRLGQGLRRNMKIPVHAQTQIQNSGVDHVREQTLPKQKEVIQLPLFKSTRDRSIGHMPETHIMPDHTISPNINAGQVPFYPDPLINPFPDHQT